MAYPSTLDSFTNPSGTQTQDTPDHAGQHSDINDAVENVQTVLGTTAGTSILKNFAAGNFPSRINGSNVLQQALQGTINSSVMGSPTVTGGTLNNIVMGTSAITGGTVSTGVIANCTVGTPALTGGTINTSVMGTPAITGGIVDFDSFDIGTSGTINAIKDEDNMASDSAVALSTQQSIKKYVDDNASAVTAGCRVHDASTQAIDNATSTAINWDSESFDVGTLHDTSTNNDRITFNATGKWLVVAQLGWNSNATGERLVQLFNGAVSLGSTREPANDSGVHLQQCSAIISATSGSYVVCRGYQSSGGTLNVRAGDGDSFFSAHRLS